MLLLRDRSLAEDPEGDDRSVDGELRFTDECVLSAEGKPEAQELYSKLEVLDHKEDVRVAVRVLTGWMLTAS